MGENSKIEWCHHTFNAWWGCQRVSPACEHCYAESFSKRLGKDLWGPGKERQVMSEKYWRQPLAWDKQAANKGERARVFCSSMADVFEDHPTVNQEREKLWQLIDQTPNLDWLLLTKRPENFGRFLPFSDCRAPDLFKEYFPNVWLGVTAENQEWADKRIPLLLEIPAAVRFVSAEPLLGPIDISKHFHCCPSCGRPRHDRIADSCGYCQSYSDWRGLDWVIVGGESGHGARPSHPDWFRSLRNQCEAAGVSFFFKQHGEYEPVTPLYDGRDESAENGRGDLIAVSRAGHIYRDCDGQPSDRRTYLMERVGKKAAGRLLDGRTWDEFPEVR